MSATPPLIVPELPKAADMLERVRAEAAELRSFTITFLSLLLYVAIIISSTTHEQILRIDPVKLPLLDVDIPIVGFYWFMPCFLFFLHLYILLQHYLFSQLAFRFRVALERETDEETKNHLRRSLGNLPFLHWLAGQHTGFMNFLMTAITVASLIIWPAWTFWWLQAAFLPYHDNTIVWTQRAFLLLDAALLAYLWAKILDDDDDAGRWWKPWLAPFFYDLTIPVKALVRWAIRWLNRQPWLAAWAQWQWPRRFNNLLRPRFGNGAEIPTSAPNPMTLATVFERWLLSVFLLTALFFSFMVSTIPDSPEEKLLVKILSFLESRLDPAKEGVTAANNSQRRILTLTNLLHEQRWVHLKDDERYDYDPARIHECDDEKIVKTPYQAGVPKPLNGIPTSDNKEPIKCYFIDGPFPRNLILNERVLIANKELMPENLSKLEAKPENLSKIEAKIEKTDQEALAKAQGIDLRGRHLEYADFRRSSLPNADLRRARLKRVNFSLAKLEKADLTDSELPGADLSRAQLSGADLSWAQLPGANLTRAELPGATLFLAQLPGANLTGAQLPGAFLFGAQLPGANLSEAQLPGADLFGAQLPGANLFLTQLPGANLSGAQLPGADLFMAQLPGANLSRAGLHGANLTGTELPGTILENMYFKPMDKEKGNTEAKLLSSALKDLPQYQGDSGQGNLTEEMDQFRQKITNSIDFSNLAASEGCLADESALKYLPLCKKMGNPEAKKIAYEIWLRLACEDGTEKHWVAQCMITRSRESRFPDFAPLLAAKMQTPDKCPGLAGLDDKWKKILLDASKKTP